MGSGSGRTARATRPAQRKLSCCAGSSPAAGVFGKQRCLWSSLWLCRVAGQQRSCCRTTTDTDHESDQANRAISTGQLNASPRLHIQPINVVVFHGPQGSSRFEVGFPLRCLQRLSRPYVATLHCGWRHNSSTRGMFIPVLSY